MKTNIVRLKLARLVTSRHTIKPRLSIVNLKCRYFKMVSQVSLIILWIFKICKLILDRIHQHKEAWPKHNGTRVHKLSSCWRPQSWCPLYCCSILPLLNQINSMFTTNLHFRDHFVMLLRFYLDRRRWWASIVATINWDYDWWHQQEPRSIRHIISFCVMLFFLFC